MLRPIAMIFGGTLLLATSVVFAATGTQEAGTGFVASSPITSKVKSKLDEDKSLAGIDVETDKHGEVWLSGTADSKALADRAVETAQSVKGVKAVHDYIDVKKAQSQIGTTRRAARRRGAPALRGLANFEFDQIGIE